MKKLQRSLKFKSTGILRRVYLYNFTEVSKKRCYVILRSWERASLVYSSITNRMQRYTTVCITINTLHVSGGSSAHHQELKTVYTASGICRDFSAPYRYRG